jgi:hypothetical protein
MLSTSGSSTREDLARAPGALESRRQLPAPPLHSADTSSRVGTRARGMPASLQDSAEQLRDLFHKHAESSLGGALVRRRNRVLVQADLSSLSIGPGAPSSPRASRPEFTGLSNSAPLPPCANPPGAAPVPPVPPCEDPPGSAPIPPLPPCRNGIHVLTCRRPLPILRVSDADAAPHHRRSKRSKAWLVRAGGDSASMSTAP